MIRYLEEHSYALQSETVAILVAAFDEVWDCVRSSGAISDSDIHGARELLAKQMVEMALRGELNHERLVDDALLRFRL